jgi:hypothetical protein
VRHVCAARVLPARFASTLCRERQLAIKNRQKNLKGRISKTGQGMPPILE